MSADLARERHNGVLHLRLDVPRRRNALSRRMLDSLAAALRHVGNDTVGVLISGADGVFSAGADFRELTGTRADVRYDEAVSDVREAILASPRLVAAAIEGPCIGAAADVALACDMRIASEDSYVWIPAVRLGLLYNPEAVVGIAGRYGGEVARRLFVLGERLAAHQAMAAGLVTEVTPAGTAVDRALQILTATKSSELDAIAATKGLILECGFGRSMGVKWQVPRIALMDSSQRRNAIVNARTRRTEGEKEDEDG